MKAIFLGKFQPPHLGHIRTIIRLSKEYSKLTVGITQSNPSLMPFQEVKKILDEVLENFINIETVLIKGSIEGGTASITDLDFDLIVSGNHKVLNILEKQGFKTKFEDRTEGVGYSGSEIRSLAQMVNNDLILQKHKPKNIVELFPVSELKPLEKVLPQHYKNIEQMILKVGFIQKPLIIDKKFKIVLEGSHRYAFLLKSGYKMAPVIFVDYADESIFVGNHLKHRYLTDESFTITKKEVIHRALHEKLFDARTTRHFFPFRKNDCIVKLDDLSKGEERDISFLLQNISVEKEIKMDESYIKELDEEIDILKQYEDEQREVRNYLIQQIKMMKKGPI